MIPTIHVLLYSQCCLANCCDWIYVLQAFSGAGNRLDGKKKNTESAPVPVQPHEVKR